MSMWSEGRFFYKLKGNLIKWWRLTILPVFRLNNNSPASVMEEMKRTQEQADTGQANTQEQPASDSLESAAAKQNLGESEMDIIARLERERQAEEARKRKEIETARKKAQEEERIAAVLNANKVNVASFIEEGKAGRSKQEKAAEEMNDEESLRKEEELRRAQEIIERLNREAAMDEAKKVAEIEEAKRQAKETFGQ